MSKNQEYAERYAGFAMEQMHKYGIPASVTLAQGILESSNGQSQLAMKENNHFGIKATVAWIEGGGRYGLYTDDKPDEKFCSYASAGDSYEHHSRFLKENKRYAGCFKLAADDYKGWAQGLERAGYATGGNYAANLQRIIEANGLDRYDRMVMETGLAQGEAVTAHYSFPVKRNEFLLVTSPFGMRGDPINPDKQQIHKGIDIQTNREAVLATEDKGKVVAVNLNANTPGGRSVTVEYERADNSKVQVSYHHLEAVGVKTGDTVNAGLQLGVSGNTGTRTTGEHLHLEVKQIHADGTLREVNPAAYLAEIAQKGNIGLQLLSDGKDLLAKFRTQGNEAPAIGPATSPEDWMKKLLSSEDSGIQLNGNDPIMELVMGMFTSLMSLAVQIDGKEQEQQMAAATQAALEKRIDLSPLAPSLESCELVIQGSARPMLHAKDGTGSYSHELTATEMNRLSLILNDTAMPDEGKRQRIGTAVNHILVAERATKSYEQGMEQRGQSDSLQIR